MHYNPKMVFSLIAGLLIILSLVIVPAAAVKVEGAKILLDVKPGTNYIFPMAVSTKPDDAPSDYAIEVYGFGQSVDGGSYAPLTATDDTGAYSARTLVTMESAVIHIDPGQRKTFNATIRIPADIGQGGRYAIIHIHPAVSGGGQTGFATAIIVPVMLTLKDSKVIESGNITNLDVGDIVEGKPITVGTTLKNTGNHHYYGIVNQVTVTDEAGKTVASTKANPLPNAVIPGQSVRVVAPISTSLSIGTYTVKSDVMLESGALLDSRTTSVIVKEAYIPPFQESSIKITPDNPATVAVPEGSITISFPQGSVFGETTVTVKPYTGTLPDLPSGATPGTTAFAIDGLSGLLAKDATIKVKYSNADLDSAHGDASKLVLGRYDRSEGRWTLLPTSVDNNARTLTAVTNRFSVWAVIATEKAPVSGQAATGSTTQSPGPEPLLVCGFIALVLLARSGRK